MNKTKLIERTIFIIIIGSLYLMYSSKNKDFKEQENLLEASYDSISKWVSKDGKNMAKIEVLETTDAETFLKLKSKDSTINELKILVEKNKKLLKKKGSAVIIKGETKIDTITNTIVIKDTITGIDIYRSNIKTKWYNIETIAKKDSTQHFIKTFSNLSLIIGLEKQGLFKKPKPYGIASDENPYTDIKDMRIYNVSLPEIKNFSLAPSINIGTNLTGEFYWSVGASLQLNKFSIKF